MQRARIGRTGNTLTIAIPEEFLDAIGLREGDEVGLGQTEHGFAVFPIHDVNGLPDDIDPEFARRVDDFIDKYRDALKSLAQR